MQPMYHLLCSSCRDKRTVAQSVLANKSIEDLKCFCGGHYQILPQGYETLVDRLDASIVCICPNCDSKLTTDDMQPYDEEDQLEERYYCIYCNTDIPIECILEEPVDREVNQFWKEDKEEEEDD